MLKIPTANDKIIWTDCQEKITYQEIEKALRENIMPTSNKQRHINKIVFFIKLLTSGRELEDPLIQLQIINNDNLVIGDGNHRATAMDYILNSKK